MDQFMLTLHWPGGGWGGERKASEGLEWDSFQSTWEGTWLRYESGVITSMGLKVE